MKRALLLLVFACRLVYAADEPEAVYARVHAAALAQDLETVRANTSEARRSTVVLPEVPGTYRLIGKAMRKDGTAVELRAVGTADSVGLGYTQMFGVVGLVQENGEWKVERVSWSAERPGEYPEGYVLLEGAAPQPRAGADAQSPHVAPPAMPPERSRLLNPRRAPETPPADRALGTEPAPCEVKPVMSDEDLRACGAQIH
jgi:hypothetical protein